MEIIFGWFLFSIIVGAIGSNRKIGFGMALLASLLLSPLIGLIITLVSESNSSIRHKEETSNLIKHQNEMIRKQNETLKKIQDPNYISEEERKEIEIKRALEEVEEKFKKGEITLEELERFKNIEEPTKEIKSSVVGKIILLAVIAFVVLYFVHLMNA